MGKGSGPQNPFASGNSSKPLSEREIASRVARLRKAISLHRQAAADLARAREEVGFEALREVEGVELAHREFEEQAIRNARNVTTCRVAEFMAEVEDDLRFLLGRYSLAHGLTRFDYDSMWAAMRGDPRPIVVDPPDPSGPEVDFFDEEDREEMRLADREIDLEMPDDPGEEEGGAA